MLETWLWDAACAIRGATDAPKFKDFILPLVFFKRLSDVFEDEFAAHVKDYGEEELARTIIEADLAHSLKTGSTPIIRFYIPKNYSWKAIRNHGADGRLGEFITEAMRDVARFNPDLQGVLDIKDYNERQSGQRTLDDDRLGALIEGVLHAKRGGRPIAELVDPISCSTIYEPACGSGGLLIKARLQDELVRTMLEELMAGRLRAGVLTEA